MKPLITRTLTGIVFVGLVVASFFLPPLFFNILFLVIALLGTWEFLNIAGKEGADPQYVIPLILIAVIFSAFQWINRSVLLLFLLLLTALFLIFLTIVVELYRKRERPIINIASSLFPVFWIAVPFGLMGMWTNFLNAGSTVLALFIIVWLYDTLAYCAGSIFGKHRLFERISPKKSWEGFLISLFLTAGIAMLFHEIPFFNDTLFTTSWHWIGFALVIIISSTFGDLAESLFKRSAQVKDSGNILPGHGGILDRFDSFLFALPAGFIYWTLFYLF